MVDEPNPLDTQIPELALWRGVELDTLIRNQLTHVTDDDWVILLPPECTGSAVEQWLLSRWRAKSSDVFIHRLHDGRWAFVGTPIHSLDSSGVVSAPNRSGDSDRD